MSHRVPRPLVVIGVALVITLVLVLLLRPIWQWRVVCVVPSGFTGLFAIEHDELRGTSPERQKDRYIYRIPPSGTYVSSKESHLIRSYSIEGFCEDGTPIPSALEVPGSQVALHRLLIDSDRTLWMFVGTQDEAEAAKASIAAAESPTSSQAE